MTMLDGVALLVAAASAVRGARNGIGLEGYRLFRLLVSVLTGFGLFTLINQVLARLLGSLLDGAEGVGFAAGIGLAFYVLRKLKGAVIGFLEKRVAPRWNRCGGATAAFVRAATAIVAILTCLHITPWIPGGTKAVDRSVIGRIVTRLIPQTGKETPP